MIAVLLAGFVQKSSAQYLQFVENKGQWDNSIRYKSDFKGGALYLKSSGYRVALHNKDDMKFLADYFGGHLDSTERSKVIKGLRKLILRSHAYEINFFRCRYQCGCHTG